MAIFNDGHFSASIQWSTVSPPKKTKIPRLQSSGESYMVGNTGLEPVTPTV